jgi:hypothetical protein
MSLRKLGPTKVVAKGARKGFDLRGEVKQAALVSLGYLLNTNIARLIQLISSRWRLPTVLRDSDCKVERYRMAVVTS